MKTAFFSLLIAAAFALGFATSYNLFYGVRAENEPSQLIVRTDTILRRDTILVFHPAHASATPSGVHEADLPLTADTSTTATVNVPLEARTYRTDSFTAVISGYLPRLDTLMIHTPCPVVTTTVSYPLASQSQPRRWGVSITAGAAMTPRGLQPALTVGVSYTLITF